MFQTTLNFFSKILNYVDNAIFGYSAPFCYNGIIGDSPIGYTTNTKEDKKDIYTIIENSKNDNQQLTPQNNSDNISGNNLNYNFLPPISRDIWKELGNLTSAKEKELLFLVDSKKWYTLRLDIKNMSNIKKQFIKNDTFVKEGYNTNFSEWMIKTALFCAKLLSAKWVYTQSDEITIVVDPKDNPKYQHLFNGRKDKLITVIASEASVFINKLINTYNRLLRTKNNEITCSKETRDELKARVVNFNDAVNVKETLDDILKSKIKKVNFDNPNLIFDCRLAEWNTEKDAFQLLFWRSYDCSVNGISDAIHEFKNKKISLASSKTKLEFLNKEGKLPLINHQAYGSLFKRIEKEINTVNKKTNKPVTVNRSVLELVNNDKNLINLNYDFTSPNLHC